MPFYRFDPNLPLRNARPSSVLFLRLTYRDSSIIMWHGGVSTTILVSSCDTMASQRPFRPHRATRWRLNDHFGLIMRHDDVSMAILVPSCDTTASQRSFRPHRATRRRLNDHLGLIVRHDGVSTTILVSSCDTTASQRPFWSHRAARRRLNGHLGLIMRHDGVSMVIHVANISSLPLTLGAGTFRGGFFGLGRLGLCRFRLLSVRSGLRLCDFRLRRGRLGF